MMVPEGIAARSGPRALSILVIDDNVHMLAILKTTLQGLGLKNVAAVSDPIKGLALATRERYDVIFVDLHMFGLDAAALVHQLRTSPNAVDRNVPVIALSALNESEIRELAQESGITTFLRKPIAPVAVLQAVAAATAAKCQGTQDGGQVPAEPRRLDAIDDAEPELRAAIASR